MAGTRRGPEGSGRPTRVEIAPGVRKNRLKERLSKAKTDRERVSRAAEHLRSVMADPAVDDLAAAQAARETVIYLIAQADRLEATITAARKEKT